jgi:alpha-L-arabinofuranosidase
MVSRVLILLTALGAARRGRLPPTISPIARSKSSTTRAAPATHDASAGEVVVNVLNRSRDKDITATIENQSGTWSGQAAVWQMHHPDLKAVHTFGDDQKVRPKTSTATLTNGSFTFPAHSLTILRFKL